MDYSEIEFYLAEYAAREGDDVSAEKHYNNAVTASIEYWGGSSDDADAYLAQSKCGLCNCRKPHGHEQK